MKTIQVVLDSKLLRAVNQAARRAHMSRSALVREHLRRLRIREMERRDREGYLRHPQEMAEIEAWKRVAVWPED